MTGLIEPISSLRTLPTVQYGRRWNNPRLLLVGAGYSVECATSILHVMGPRVPGLSGLLDEIQAAVTNGNWQCVNATWLATHLLTNGIFRIASAVEKIATLHFPRPLNSRKSERENLWDRSQDPKSGKFYSLLGRAYRVRKLRLPYLDNEVRRFKGGERPGAIRFPLASCMYQADADKHRLTAPMPRRARYLSEIARRGLIQAVELYNESWATT